MTEDPPPARFIAAARRAFARAIRAIAGRAAGRACWRSSHSRGAAAFVPPDEPARGGRPAASSSSPGGESSSGAGWTKRSALAWAAVVLLFVAAAARAPTTSSDIPAVAPRSPTFRLSTLGGTMLDQRAMIGRPYAIFFGFTRCPEICPATLAEVTRAADEAGASDEFGILFVTLDPERDTPEILSDFASSFHRPIIALAGAPESVARAADAFRVYWRKVPLSSADYTIDHTALVYLVDRRGVLAATISFGDGANLAATTLTRFLLEQQAIGSRERAARRGE